MNNLPSVSQLRWRARVTKEAVFADDSRFLAYDPERALLLGDGSNNEGITGAGGDKEASWSKSKGNRRCCCFNALSCAVCMFQSCRQENCQRQILYIIVGATIGASLCALKLNKSWWTTWSSTLLVGVSILVLIQAHAIQQLGSSTMQQQELLKQAVQQCMQQNERLYRTLTRMDTNYDRVQKVQAELSRIVAQYAENESEGVEPFPISDGEELTTRSAKSAYILPKISRLAQEFNSNQAEIQEYLQWQVQAEIVRAALESDNDGNFCLSPPELDRLILRLQMMPGVCVNETTFREMVTHQQLQQEGSERLEPVDLAWFFRVLRRMALEGSSSSLSSSSSIRYHQTGVTRGASSNSSASPHRFDSTSKKRQGTSKSNNHPVSSNLFTFRPMEMVAGSGRCG